MVLDLPKDGHSKAYRLPYVVLCAIRAKLLYFIRALCWTVFISTLHIAFHEVSRRNIESIALLAYVLDVHNFLRSIEVGVLTLRDWTYDLMLLPVVTHLERVWVGVLSDANNACSLRFWGVFIGSRIAIHILKIPDFLFIRFFCCIVFEVVKGLVSLIIWILQSFVSDFIFNCDAWWCDRSCHDSSRRHQSWLQQRLRGDLSGFLWSNDPARACTIRNSSTIYFMQAAARIYTGPTLVRYCHGHSRHLFLYSCWLLSWLFWGDICSKRRSFMLDCKLGTGSQSYILLSWWPILDKTFLDGLKCERLCYRVRG